MTDFRKARSSRVEDGEEATESLDSNKNLLQYVGFVFGAVRRRKLLTATVFLLVLAAAVSFVRSLPKSYHVETKILAQRQQALPMMARSTMGEEAPTYVASEIIHRRDNLLSLIEKTRLMDHWKFTEPPLLSKDEKTDALAMVLDQKLTVTIGEGTLGISIDWPDGQMAFQLVEVALQNFLEARRSAEISTIDEAIALLEARAERVRSEIESMDVEGQLRAVKSGQAKAQAKRNTEARAGRFDPEVSRFKAMLEARRRMIKDSEDLRQRRLQELQVQLAEKLAVYGESYPNVVSLRQEIKAYSQEPQRLAELRSQERELEATLARRTGNTESSEANTIPDEKDDPAFRNARLQYDSLLARIEGARIDLDTARAAFKYRYSVIWPAQMPGGPNKPNVPRGIAIGFIIALFLAVSAATAADIRAGRFVESWQVESVLDLPVLAEVEKPRP